jgi:tRNA A37 threonylcarbamoyladenosine dehydratase
VAVFGVGGVGSFTAEALARSGIGTIALFDNDRIAASNINRQLPATHKTIGKLKVEVMKERLQEINPKLYVGIHCIFYDKTTAEQIDLSHYSYIVDAIDTVTSKILLIQHAQSVNVPIISSMGAGNKLDPTRFEVADIYQTSVCPLARTMRNELRKKGVEHLKVVYSKEEPVKLTVNPTTEEPAPRKRIPGSIAFVPSVAGLILAGEVIKDLINF